ncbi:MAG: BrnA antitoxin family protein [Bacteriovorax sp.]
MAKIKLSKKSVIAPDEFEPKYAKERISIWIDEDVLDEFKKIARNNNKKYQSLINEVLRNYAFSQKAKNVDKIIEKIEQAMKELRRFQQI